MALYSNAGSTTSGSSQRTSSTGERAAGSGVLSKTVSASSNSEVNSAEISSGGSFAWMTATSSGRAEGAAAASSPVPEMGLRRSGSGTGGGGKSSKKRFVGVRQRPSGRWVAEIKDTTQKIRLWLGTFDTAEDAARAYDEAAWLLRGANTRTNFVPSINSKTDAPALPSKAARLLQLRRNAAAKSGSNNSRQEKQEKQQQQVAHSLALNTGNLSRSEGNSTPILCQAQHPAVPCPGMESEVKEGSLLPPGAAEVTRFESENLSTDVSNSEFESSVEMCGLEESPAPEYNATSSVSSDLANQTEDQTEFQGALGSCRSETVVKQEAPRGFCSNGTRESSAIRENRKENDYCSEPPLQEILVDDTDMSSGFSSGLSGLDDVDLSGGENSVYSSSPFDFSADMGSGLDFSPSPLSSEDESAFFSEQLRRLPYERQISAGLYAMNGVHESLSLSHSSWGTSSPSLTLAAGFRRSPTSAPFLTSSPLLRKSSSTGATTSIGGTNSWGTSVDNLSSASTGTGSGESLQSPREDALWQSWDLAPLCVVA